MKELSESKTSELIDGTPDAYLAQIVTLTNSGAIQNVKITLTVGGHLVSGVVVGAQEFFASSAGRLLGKNAQTEKPALYAIFNPLHGDTTDLSKHAQFIHLKDVTLWSGNSPTKVPVWRGRLQEVEGFCFGILEQKRGDDAS